MTIAAHARTGRYLLYGSQTYALAILRPLQDAIRRRGGEAAWFFDGPGADFLRSDEKRLRTVAEAREFDPLAIFVPGNAVPDFLPGVKVEVFHGFSVGKRSDNRGHFRIRGLFDLYCTQGRTTTERFRELAAEHGHFHVVETGWPKIDPLFLDSGDIPNAWLAGWGTDRPVVLYASTFTRSLTSAPALRETIRELASSGKWNWLVMMHPKMDPEIVRSYRTLQGPHLRFADTDDVIPLLRAGDVMLSDTSSVVFEFLLQHRPAVTFRNTRPGPHVIDIREAADAQSAIEKALTRPPDLMREIVSFGEAIHPYRDGKSSERVLDATHEFIERYQGKLARKPLNLWRKLRLRRRLGYYRVR